MLNVALFFFALAKAALYTGVGPGILMVYGVETWASARRVPARKVLLEWQKCMYIESDRRKEARCA